jgi:hypothetical protein
MRTADERPRPGGAAGKRPAEASMPDWLYGDPEVYHGCQCGACLAELGAGPRTV